MDTQLENYEIKFELVAVGPHGRRHVYPVTKRRCLIGRGQACDIVLPFGDVSTIHAVLEFDGKDQFKIFDLDSKNGTIVNNQKVVVEQVLIETPFFIGNNQVEVKTYRKDDLPAAPLTILEKEIPRIPTRSSELPQPPLETLSTKKDISDDHIPHMEYPLARDPHAEFSEYIFEDADNLYPIFKYEVDKSAVEVIIVFNDRIQSVDYIPADNGAYSLVGSDPHDHEIEYPYLGKKEKFPLVKMVNGEAELYTPVGYNVKSIGGNQERVLNNAFVLDRDEVIQFSNQHIQIYARSTEKPPKIASAPVFQRDSELRKYLFLTLFLVFSFLIPVSLFRVDVEVEKDKAPERIATILYKRKLTTSKSRAIQKTKKAPKKVQKSPKAVIAKKKPKNIVKKKPKKVVKSNANPKKNGRKTSKKVGKVKKGAPNKGRKTVRKDTVRPTSRIAKAGSAGTRRRVRAANTTTRSKGAVDTYKSADFSSSISNLMSKGGTTKSFKAISAASSGIGTSAISGAESGATLKTAKVSNNTGSLSGVARGTLDSSKGAEGLVDKKSIYTAGLPFKTVILGGLDPDVIRQILVENIPRFRYCYQKVLDHSKNAFNGVVKLDFIIGASGHVTKAGVDSVTNVPGSVRSCVVNVLRRIRFPEPRGGGVTEVSQPMNFYPRMK